jgi:CHASE2 domain-containing sensor protein/tRNA A-37 threonylcarbamoyl transferase component Bud32
MLGQVLNGRYKLIRVLGAGGFGQTYIAIDTQTAGNPQCVVKQLKPASQDKEFLKIARRLFETEVHTLSRLGENSCIPRLLDSFEDHQEFYLVQEFIDGEPLSEEIQRQGRLSEAQVIELLREALTILKFVHDNRVVHRDLKPDNLIRRKRDRKLCLIDFGAVKEIRTQLHSGEISTLTVGIGTQGYTPSEQLAGKPRYSSDLFSLGMTAIHALTGRSPADLPEDPESLEPRWQDFAQVSPGLAILIRKMVRHYIYQRYQQAEDVLKDLDRLDELLHEVTLQDFPQTFLPQPTVWQPGWKEGILAVAIASLVASTITLGLRHLRIFVPLELAVHDWLVAHQPDPGPDPRLLLVEITENDLSNLQRETPSDQSLADAIEILQTFNPAVIGLDLHRDLPQPPGTDQLRQSLAAPNLIGITKLGDGDDSIPPPPGLPPEQIGFNDFPLDPDNKIRRNLLFASKSTEPGTPVYYSFGLRVALHYLADQRNLMPEANPQNPEYMNLGVTPFIPLGRTFGGYQSVDAAGYQVFLQYRSPQNIARRLSISDVLDQRITRDQVENKIVLIGTTAYTSRDKFFTPYSLLSGDNYQMSGVEVHAQMISQILRAALDSQSLPWAWPDWLEILWIVGCASGGSILVWTAHRPARLWLKVMGATAGIIGVSSAYFFLNAWVPVVAPFTTFIIAGSSLLAYRRYQQKRLEHQWRQQGL